MSLVILTTRKTVGPFEIKERKPKLTGVTKYVVFKGEEGMKDFGRYSAAIRWCRQQLPKEVPHIVITLSEDEPPLMWDIVATSPVHFTIIDESYHHIGDAAVDPERVAMLLETPLSNNETSK